MGLENTSKNEGFSLEGSKMSVTYSTKTST